MTEKFNVNEWMQDVSNAALKVADAFKKVVTSWGKCLRKITIKNYTGNHKVKHLALHAKKARVRKKNYHRILKENRR